MADQWLENARAARTEGLRAEILAGAVACAHENILTGPPSPFIGPVAGGRENPAAHGNVEVADQCSRCGLSRRRLVNGLHEEVGPWGVDEGYLARRVRRELPD
mgnify:CR=1 FL=1